MRLELDHLFVCTAPGAPEAEELIRLGLREGPSNHHPGQGTANRRFSFENAMLELLWVSNAKEAQSEQTRRTLLWERWSGRESGACPFGICLRPRGPGQGELPFPAWEYRPAYLGGSLVMHIEDAGVEEAMWLYLGFARRSQREQYFLEHPLGVREMTGLVLTGPAKLASGAAKAAIDSGVLSKALGPKFHLQIEFDGGRANRLVQLEPHLPLTFKI